MIRWFYAIIAAALGVGLAGAVAQAPDMAAWPTKPIKAYIPFGAGSATDVVPRAVFDGLATDLGQPIFKPGLDAGTLDALVAGAREYALRNFGVALPDAVSADLHDYAARQLRAMVDQGRATLVATAGALPLVYSVAQLQLDVARFGVARSQAAASATTAFAKGSVR